jgi:menaquinone-specific isochorismate synthase
MAGSGDASEEAYRTLVALGLQEIARGTFAKVVLCRARRIALPPGASATRAFSFLDARHTACARFLLAAGAARFIGATPERLVFVRGRRVLTEALAGSLPRRAGLGEGDARAELLASTKDRAEHVFVVAALRAALAPVCEGLSIPEEPVVRSLPHVLHLATPIAGTLALRSHALDLAARLHPTPALCGTPKAAARAFILANEAQPRGWYGGAAGWFDTEGDGAFGVAIRSALIAGADAWIYAGAGIVAGSDPERELVETIAKERTMREALDAASAPAAEGTTAASGRAPAASREPR